MEAAAKSLTSKSQADNVLDTADKIREKIKNLQAFDLSYFTRECYFEKDGSEII